MNFDDTKMKNTTFILYISNNLIFEENLFLKSKNRMREKITFV